MLAMFPFLLLWLVSHIHFLQLVSISKIPQGTFGREGILFGLKIANNNGISLLKYLPFAEIASWPYSFSAGSK